MSDEADRVFLAQAPGSGMFRFDDAVAKVFADMLRRSIPGYTTLLHLIGLAAKRSVTDGSNVYDLGASLGAVTLTVRHALGSRNATIFAVDNSEAMVRRCAELVAADVGETPVEVHLGDAESFPLKNASLVIVNFTLQFIPKEKRELVIRRIYESLLPGGVLILSEKVEGETSEESALFHELHDEFRESNGYSQLELARKRQALENVLVPERCSTHVERLAAVGFTTTLWFRSLCFASFYAVKPTP